MKHTITLSRGQLIPILLALVIGSILAFDRAKAIDINTEKAVLDGDWARVCDLIQRDETIYDPVRMFLWLQSCVVFDKPCAPIFSGLAWEPWGPPRSAYRYAAALTARNPGNPHAIYLMAASLATTEQLERARALYSEAIRYDTNMAHAYLGRGVLNYRLGDTDAALADLTEVLDIFPGHAAAHLNRALIYFAEGETEKALADVDSTAYLEGHRSRAFLLRGGIFAQLNEPDSAIEYYSRALENDDMPARELVFFYRAKEYIKTGEFKKAREDFEKFAGDDRFKELDAHKQARRSIEVFKRIDRPWEYSEKLREGMVLTEFGHYDAAPAILTEALAKDSTDDKALYYRSKALAGLGRFEEALADISAAIKLNPHDPVLHYNRGFYHEIVGDKEAALADYSRAVKIDPEFLEAYEARGWVHECNGSREEAVENYRAYVESPADPDARRKAAYRGLIEILQEPDTCRDTKGISRTLEAFWVAEENENWDEVARYIHSQVLHELQNPIDPRQHSDRRISLWKRQDPLLRRELAVAPPGRFYRLIKKNSDRNWPGEPSIRFERVIGISCRGRGFVTIRYLTAETFDGKVHYSIADDDLKMESGLWKLVIEDEDSHTIKPVLSDFLEYDR